MFCPNCGSPMHEGATFCTQCGTSVRDIQRITRRAAGTGASGFSFGIIVVALLELLGGILVAFTPFLNGPRRMDTLSPLLGWTRGDRDYAWVHGTGDLTKSESDVLIITIIFLFFVVLCIAMALVKKWMKGSAFLMLGTYGLYMPLLKAVAEDQTGHCTYAPMAWINLIIFAIAAFVSLGFSSGKKKQGSTGPGLMERITFSGKRIGVIACAVAFLPGLLAWGVSLDKITRQLNGFAYMVVTIVIILFYTGLMITCMIFIGKRNSRAAMTIAFVIAGIGSMIVSLGVGSMGLAILALAGAIMMIIGMIGVYGSHVPMENTEMKEGTTR